jgi:hypothetical protein
MGERREAWIPAFAGKTEKEQSRLQVERRQSAATLRHPHCPLVLTLVLLEQRVNCLSVVDDAGHIQGIIITTTDPLNAFQTCHIRLKNRRNAPPLEQYGMPLTQRSIRRRLRANLPTIRTAAEPKQPPKISAPGTPIKLAAVPICACPM